VEHTKRNQIPNLYKTEDVKLEDKIVYPHFFIGGTDWYICEYSPEERLFWGYIILNNDYQMAEWGYISFDELIDLSVTARVRGQAGNNMGGWPRQRKTNRAALHLPGAEPSFSMKSVIFPPPCRPSC
jgi:hypothetical protein